MGLFDFFKKKTVLIERHVPAQNGNKAFVQRYKVSAKASDFNTTYEKKGKTQKKTLSLKNRDDKKDTFKISLEDFNRWIKKEGYKEVSHGGKKTQNDRLKRSGQRTRKNYLR